MTRARTTALLFPLWVGIYGVIAIFFCAGIQAYNPSESIGGLDALRHGVLAGRDTISHDYPAAWWGWGEIARTGDIPLWNPSWFCGEPFIASQTFLPFYPANWLMGLLPLPLGFNIQYPLHLVIAAAVMLWTCRRRAIGWWAAGFAGLVWGFSGHLATLVGPGHMQKLQTLAWLPLTVYGLGAFATRRPQRGILPAALGITLQILAGHPQILYLSLIAGGLELLMRSVKRGMRDWKRRDQFLLIPRENFWRNLYSSFRIPHFAFALLLVFLLPAILWIPTAEFARLSNRQGALSWTDATRGSLPPEEAFEFILPRFKGDSLPHGRGAYIGRMGVSPTSGAERMTSDYIGAGTFLLAVVALILPGRRRAAFSYWLLAALALLMSMGGFLGNFYAALLKIIPGLSHFRSPSTNMALLTYACAMAAAVGIESLKKLRKEGAPPGSQRFGLGFIWAICVISIILFAWTGQQSPRKLDISGFSTDQLSTYFYHRSIHDVTFPMSFIAILLITLLSLRSRTFSKIASNGALVFIFLNSCNDLSRGVRPFWNAIEARPFTQYMQSSFAMPHFEQTQSQGPARYYEPGGELKNWALTYTDFSRRRAVATLTGYHPVSYLDYYRIVDALGFTNPKLLNLFSINYLLAPATQSAINSGGRIGFKEVARGQNQILMHNPEIKYLRPAGELTAVAEDADVPRILAGPNFDPRTATLTPSQQFLTESPKNEFEIEYRVASLGPGETEIEYRSSGRGLVVISEPAIPGWRATLRLERDDPRPRELPIARANGYFMLLGPIEAGNGILTLTYDPPSHRLGLHLTLLGLALFGFLLGRGRNPNTEIAKINGDGELIQ